VGQLLADHRLVDQTFAESSAHHAPLKALTDDLLALTNQVDVHQPAFMVKVKHDALEALVFFAEQVAHRHLHAVLDDQGGARSATLRGFDVFGSQIVVALD